MPTTRRGGQDARTVKLSKVRRVDPEEIERQVMEKLEDKKYRAKYETALDATLEAEATVEYPEEEDGGN